MKQAPETDQELIAAVLAGSEAAFAQLVERYRDRLFRLLGRYCRDPIEVEDLAQDVFLKVFRKLHTFQGDSAFYTWLYRIAVNAATDRLARASHRRLKLVGDDAMLDGTFGGGGSRSAEEGPHGSGSPGRGDGRPRQGEVDRDDPAAPLLRDELVAATRRIVDGLPEKYRTILILREFEDLSYTEIAAVLQCNLGTVESRLFRARQRFKAALEQHHPELLPRGAP
ncbi:MAG: sigma-70 family RNA polymerase sigma factor [Planctomycetes bacterium]|nr:sigma-70 family RNA polymerase sigma factor [Planctomycetota bacterium]